MATGDKSYLMRAGRTITGSALEGKVPSTQTAGQYLGYPERDYVEGIIQNVNRSNINEVRAVLPEPAVAAMYKEIGMTGAAFGAMKDVKGRILGRQIPGFESTIYSENVPLETPAIQTFQQESANAHDAGMGWYDQMAAINRSEMARIYNPADTLFENSYGTTLHMRDVNTALDNKDKLRKELLKISSSVTITDDGMKGVSVEVSRL
jgi:hypothetical protein